MIDGGAIMLNSDGEQIDLLTQELEKVDHVEPMMNLGNANVTIGTSHDIATRGNASHERTSSLPTTSSSDPGNIATENESLLGRHPHIGSIISSGRMSMESPSNSGGNTPKLTAKQRRELLRSENTTPASSLTSEPSPKPH